MEEKLRNLLDKTYELEGLLHLALKRDVSSEDFLRLISKKGKEVFEMCNSLDIVEETAYLENFSENRAFDLDEYTIDDESENATDKTDPIEILTDIIEPEIKPNSDNFNTELTEENKNGKLVFSINERFRYKKELFDNSDADFNTTLALVASMDDYDEAEDYFLNEIGFESTNPIVVEFLKVIKRYFK